MVVTDGSAAHLRFEGDSNVAGRRERLSNRTGRDEVTGKVTGMQGPPPAAPVGNDFVTFRPKVGRHSFEIEVSCTGRLLDMEVNKKRRQLFFIGEDGRGSQHMSNPCEIPRSFDLEAMKVLSDDFENGKCRLSFPPIGQSVF